MKINSENSGINTPNNFPGQEIREKSVENTDNGIAKRTDMVEINGDSMTRSTFSRKVNPYEQSQKIDEPEITKATMTPFESQISQDRLNEIKDKIKTGYYDREEVYDSISRLLMNDVRRVDKNI